ncbi:hypothetical protein GCM10011282_22940 [Undibacterium macrobrachii]|uniref:Uncharacterized protein n=1 Tax=Undibacterium macrobrachii TaxID=1119058 RepID=A0ABQ2XGP4_9BURK|nr:hypothetical protein GCM10011282_22940 [Undibacterium macrobrachii]
MDQSHARNAQSADAIPNSNALEDLYKMAADKLINPKMAQITMMAIVDHKNVRSFSACKAERSC